jgi:UDP-N-acetylglucosamine diphosphorylase/glucosamine-1-phosphate N-acetyltransferase
MQIVFFDDQYREDLFPFLMTRPAATLRCGILTIEEKWKRRLSDAAQVFYLVPEYLSPLYPVPQSNACLFINGALLPSEELLRVVSSLKEGQQIVHGDRLLAKHQSVQIGDNLPGILPDVNLESIAVDCDVKLLCHPWEMFLWNDTEIRADFDLLTYGRTSQTLSSDNTLIGNGGLFIEQGARVSASVINTETGPVYIAAHAEVMEGCLVRGPFALGSGAVLKMGARIYGATTIGPGCKVGGEVSNSVLLANSNKAHDGFLGNSVIGEWCNLGADTNNSNLKNNYSTVRVWNHRLRTSVDTGLQFCGLFMGDHSKCGINTMFNTGTVVDVFANVFGSGFPPKHIPSFTWGEEGSYFILDKAIEAAERVMARRGKSLGEVGQSMLRHLYLSMLQPRSEE